jgi:tetratricopeptide (TPR) repeat protein
MKSSCGINFRNTFMHLPKMRKHFLAIAAIISCNFSFACGNEYHRTELPIENGNLNTKFLLDYDYNEKSNALPYWTHGFEDGLMIEKKSYLEQYNKTKDYKYLSDYAWELVKEGKAKQAIIILDSLLKTHPIVGNNTKALELLTKAVAINKNSHYGSEWIHLNILKHKINKDGFPLEKIIDLGIDDYNSQWNTATWKYSIPSDSLLKSIAYQLHERIGFIAPKDKIIGRLIFDFATIIAKTKSKEEALPFYDYAMYYDNELYLKIVQAKEALPKSTTTITTINKPLDWNANILIPVAIALITIAFILGRKSAKK